VTRFHNRPETSRDKHLIPKEVTSNVAACREPGASYDMRVPRTRCLFIHQLQQDMRKVRISGRMFLLLCRIWYSEPPAGLTKVGLLGIVNSDPNVPITLDDDLI
jgi:hypothetical protein